MAREKLSLIKKLKDYSLKTIPVDNSICGGKVLRLMFQKKK